MATVDTKKKLIKRYHTIAHRLNMNDEQRSAFLSAYGVDSSKDLTVPQLAEACKLLEKKDYSSTEDKWRKRVMASIFGYFALIGRKNVDAVYVKQIACRAAGDGYTLFNTIPVDRLRAIYHSFKNQSDVFKRSGEIINQQLDHMQFKN